VLVRYGIALDRAVRPCSSGRITRQKGLSHTLWPRRIVRSGRAVDSCCAGAPDTPRSRPETEAGGRRAGRRPDRAWCGDYPRHAFRVLSWCSCSPRPRCSVSARRCTRPLGNRQPGGLWLVRPPVVASAVGGIPEVVADGVTGLLVPASPSKPSEFEAGLASAVNELALNPARAAAMGRRARPASAAERRVQLRRRSLTARWSSTRRCSSQDRSRCADTKPSTEVCICRMSFRTRSPSAIRRVARRRDAMRAELSNRTVELYEAVGAFGLRFALPAWAGARIESAATEGSGTGIRLFAVAGRRPGFRVERLG